MRQSFPHHPFCGFIYQCVTTSWDRDRRLWFRLDFKILNILKVKKGMSLFKRKTHMAWSKCHNTQPGFQFQLRAVCENGAPIPINARSFQFSLRSPVSSCLHNWDVFMLNMSCKDSFGNKSQDLRDYLGVFLNKSLLSFYSTRLVGHIQRLRAVYYYIMSITSLNIVSKRTRKGHSISICVVWQLQWRQKCVTQCVNVSMAVCH